MKVNTIFSGLCALTLILSLGCANKSGFSEDVAVGPSSGDAAANTPSSGADSEKTPNSHPLLWESAHKDGIKWSQHVYKIINNETPDLVQGAQDITSFCPKYFHLTTEERINFWGLLISSIVKFESRFDPTSRMHETTMGIDPITRRPVYSEGLMQLSYQDIRPYPFCDFDWDQDKDLRATDPRKTILDPYKNLSCGVKILARQIKARNRITLSTGVYWSVLKLNGKYSKIPQIAALTKKMPSCMN